jgi:hypothetical protein
LDGISNWGVGDWATFNGTAWQRVEGGAAGNFTDLTASGTVTLSGGTANGVTYLNGSKVLTTGSALTFDGSGNLVVGGTSALVSASGRGNITVNGSTDSILSFGSAGTNTGYLYATTSGMELASIGSTFVRFSTNGSERARIDSSGNLLVGTTSSFDSGKVSIQTSANNGVVVRQNASGGYCYGARAESNGGVYYLMYFQAGTTDVGSISSNGTTTSYNTTSDQRLKENIQDAASASTLIDAIQVREYDWKSDGSHQRYGFIAQELVTVAPEAVHQPADPDAMMAVDYSKLVPMLVKEIQSLRARVASLESN